MRRNGFTLAELLVTITIILILSGISLRALVVAQEYARADKTRATIAKINHDIMEMYESYRMRKLPANLAQLPGEATPCTRQQLYRRTLDATRDMMRLEMPDRWSDVTNGPLAFSSIPYTDWWPAAYGPWCRRPALSTNYQRRYANSRARLLSQGMTAAQADSVLLRNQSAECLYLLVTSHNNEAREYFLDSEVADTDGDQLFEFIDGWGRPISFLRWAPAFTDSEVQAVVFDVKTGLYNDTSGHFSNASATLNGSIGTVIAAVQTSHDPFDSRDVDKHSWKLTPLVYSAGADGDYGLNEVSVYAGNPFCLPDRLDTTLHKAEELSILGKPLGTAHFDNIHNHRSVTQ